MSADLTKKLTFANIADLLGQKFYIPGYQRGYRWQPGQVIALLDDIWEFYLKTKKKHNSEGVKYCLQPLVVAYKQDSDEWEVIDGQQRLTTVFLLLQSLDMENEFSQKCYSIRYETPYAENQYFLDINKVDIDNIDSYHLKEAQRTINLWLQNLQNNEQIRRTKLLDLLLDPNEYLTHFIWYNVTEEVNKNNSFAIDIFDRLNVGKIGLTNAELIKALFMTSLPDNTQKERKQIQIGEEWDNIERTLGKPEFWNFICQEPEKYVTRIEYLFDILQHKGPEDEEQFTFNKYYREISESEEELVVENKWKEISTLFQTFCDWFDDKDYYHLVGYLITIGKPIQEVLDARRELIETEGEKKEVLRSKRGLKRKLLDMAKTSIKDVELNDDDFYRQSSRPKIRQVLLLFNVLSIIKTNDQNLNFMRFPFDLYREKDDRGRNIWDIEHIHSQSDKDITGEDRPEWIETMLMYFTGKESFAEAQEALNSKENFVAMYYDPQTSELAYRYCTELMRFHDKVTDEQKLEFQRLYDDLRRYFKEEDDETFLTHSLGNLTLLDRGTNRSYRNSFFPVKRMIVLNKAKSGVFIPLCTQNVFLKAYSKKLGNLTSWTGNDSEDYKMNIIETINSANYDK